MAVMRIHYYAKALQMASVMHAVLPQDAPVERTVVLLGPEGSDSTWWLRRCLLEALAQENRCAFVLPSVLEGCGFDMAYGYRFGTSLREDVPQWLSRHLPAIPAGEWHIAGYGVSGAAAVHAALACPQRYTSAASFGGRLDLQKLFDGEHPYLNEKRLQCLFGSREAAPDLTALKTEDAQGPALLVIAPEGSGAVEDARRMAGCETVLDSLAGEMAPQRCLGQFLSFLQRGSGVSACR